MARMAAQGATLACAALRRGALGTGLTGHPAYVFVATSSARLTRARPCRHPLQRHHLSTNSSNPSRGPPEAGHSRSEDGGGSAVKSGARWTALLLGTGLLVYTFLPSDAGSRRGSSTSPGSRTAWWATSSRSSGSRDGSGKANGGGAVLRPDRYGRFVVLDVQRTTSPSFSPPQGRAPGAEGLAEYDPTGDGQHVLLRIQARAPPADGAANASASTRTTAVEDVLADALRIESVYMKEPALQIERAYTPLRRPTQLKVPPSSAAQDTRTGREQDDGDGVIELLIKRYEDGELSRYAASLRPGDVVELRGPVATWDVRRDHPSAVGGEGAGLGRDIVMLVGGTGVTTAHQLLHTLAQARPYLKSRDALTRGEETSEAASTLDVPAVHVLYAAPRPSSFLLLPELAWLSDSTRGSWQLFAESLGDKHALQARSSALSSRLAGGAADERRASSWWQSLPFLSPPPTLLGTSIQQGRLSQDAIERTLRRATISAGQGVQHPPLVLVCGPDGMVAALAGPKSRDGRGAQGALDGVLGRLGALPENVYKL